MTTPSRKPFQRHRFPAKIISYRVWLSFRVYLGYRDLEELLFEPGSQ